MRTSPPLRRRRRRKEAERAPFGAALWLLAAVAVGSSSLPVGAQAPGSAEARGEARRLMEAGKQAFRAKKYEQAADLFEKAHQADPSLLLALYNRAFSLRKAGKLARARDAYFDYVQANPDDNDGLFGLAETERLLENNAEAHRLFGEYLKREKRPSKRKYVDYAQRKVAELKPAAPKPDAALADQLRLGTEAYKAGRYVEAAEYFERAYVLSPTTTAALYRRALSLRKAKKYDDALSAYLAYRKKVPEDLDGLFGLAETYRLLAQKEPARSLFEDYVAKEKRADRQAYVRYAEGQLGKLATPPPPGRAKAEALFAEGMKAYRAKEYAPAAEKFAAALAADATFHKAGYRLALARRKAGDLDGARAAYTAYLEAVPSDPDGVYGLAETERLANNVPAARERFARYIELETRPSEQKYVERARRYLDETGGPFVAAAPAPADTAGPRPVAPPPAPSGKVPVLAAGASDSALLGRRLTTARMLKHGEDALASGEAHEADRHFSLAVALAPDEPAAHYGKGRALDALGEGPRAAEAFRKAYALGPASEAGMAAKRRLRDGPAARGGGRHVTTTAQKKAQGLYEQAAQLAKDEVPDEAIDKLNEAVQADPTHADSYLLLGELHLAQKSGPRALVAYQRAMVLLPESAEPIWGVARAYELAGEHRVAMHHYRLYTRSKAADVDGTRVRKAWLKLEGVDWGGS